MGKIRIRSGDTAQMIAMFFQLKKMKQEEEMAKIRQQYMLDKSEREDQRLQMDIAMKGLQAQHTRARTDIIAKNVMSQVEHRAAQEDLAKKRLQLNQWTAANKLALDQSRTSAYVTNLGMRNMKLQQEATSDKANQEFLKEMFQTATTLEEGTGDKKLSGQEKSMMFDQRAADLLRNLPGIRMDKLGTTVKLIKEMTLPKGKPMLKYLTDPDGNMYAHLMGPDGKELGREKVGLDDKHFQANRNAILKLSDSYDRELRAKVGEMSKMRLFSPEGIQVPKGQEINEYMRLQADAIKEMGTKKDYIRGKLKMAGDDKALSNFLDKAISEPVGSNANPEMVKKFREKLLGYAGRPGYWNIVERMKKDAASDPETSFVLNNALDSIYQDFGIEDPNKLDQDLDFTEEANDYDLENPSEDED